VPRYNAANLAALALGPGRPDNAAIVTKELTNVTTLTWTPVSRATGYEIVRRASTDSDWTSAIPGGDVTTFTVPFSKDDWLFGVRAVDARGRRSAVAFPVLRRN
jgi:hypothetical protein